MGVEPPYLYDAPSRHSTAEAYYDFNPKVVTQARSSSPLHDSPRTKAEGPLIDFNRHPDSYIIVPYGQTDVPPMPENTRKKVTVTRWVQFGLRAVQLLGTLGLLVCVICIRGTQDAEGWILRIPPVVDTLVALYALYHLLRPAKGRSAASSASYHFFALFMDAGLIPFFVFVAIMANSKWNEVPSANGRWRSFFSTDTATDKLLLATWIIAIVQGSLHHISLAIDLYLAIIFRRIARMPPDMNPLEVNLTRRPTNKHKHKNSELGLSMSQKHLSGSTLALSPAESRFSAATAHQQDPLLANPRSIPFSHSRTNSDPSFSPHNPETARLSRTEPSDQAYQQSSSARSSRADQTRFTYSRANSVSPSKRTSTFLDAEVPALQPTSERLTSPPPGSYMTARSDAQSRYRTPSPGPQAAMSGTEAKQAQRQGFMSDNWYIFPDGASSQSSLSDVMHMQTSEHDFASRTNKQASRYRQHAQREQQPLGMNPPTPQMSLESIEPLDDDITTVSAYSHSDEATRVAATRNDYLAIRRALTSASNGSSVYSESAQSLMASQNGVPKSKHYGDLAGAMRGVRGQYSPVQSSERQFKHSPTNRNGWKQNRTHGYNVLDPERDNWYTASPDAPESIDSRSKSPTRSQSRPRKDGRVVSRTGADIADASVLYFDDRDGQEGWKYENGRGRDVSGKVAEEGRGGRWGVRRREVSGTA
ncbi:hypothetical protein LTR66_009148 [Elasticomyces elasticus]|nr:hypothetical protein LTR66_009148 [Elasticomyces elasticus]